MHQSVTFPKRCLTKKQSYQLHKLSEQNGTVQDRREWNKAKWCRCNFQRESTETR